MNQAVQMLGWLGYSNGLFTRAAGVVAGLGAQGRVERGGEKGDREDSADKARKETAVLHGVHSTSRSSPVVRRGRKHRKAEACTHGSRFSSKVMVCQSKDLALLAKARRSFGVCLPMQRLHSCQQTNPKAVKSSAHSREKRWQPQVF